MKNKILEERMLYQNRWTEMVEVVYCDEKNQIRSWEVVNRKGLSKVVVVVPRLLPSGRFVLIRQFRPPTGKYILEFPAGLIDEGETPVETALRELKEETGYYGRIDSVTPPLYTSPGLLSEACYLANVSIDEKLEENQLPQAQNEPDESIKVILKKPEQMLDYLDSESELGNGIDIKLYTYFSRIGFNI